MTPTDTGRRIDELYFDTTDLKRMDLCCMVANREADLDAARAENKRLREDNDRLRELAERAWKTAERLCQAFDGPCRADDVTAYKPCPMGERDEECVYGQLQRELRELGVEVE